MPLSNTPAILPEEFVPDEHTIIIGRGRLVKQHSANRKFDKMVEAIAQEYAATPSKAEKGLMLTHLINEIHEAAPLAGFVRKDPTTNQWTLVEESIARQTAAQAIRNVLSHSYRSSKQSKSKRRFQQIAAEKQLEAPTQPLFLAPKISPVFTMSLPPRCVSPSENSCSSLDSSGRSACSRCGAHTMPEETLSLLVTAFGQDLTEDPFEPRPILALPNGFEPIPFAM
ncbi:Nitrilase family, member 2 [Seminavis robusta]|uniref:Nitrilase family, member 2 n=1 Tax=Seminavis robusta TaxID=568900 RepID=A0A9N8H9I2_9STRA|nr:Nitrilase family, member 2 [Seminavis robusta]|eukprot:Sro255_g100490.1 Nitrilase family, member 2 (226) ;mRNA; f:77276-77953